MTDAFAIMGFPRSPWLDPDEVRAAFQRLAACAHPDRSGSTADFSTLSNAYTILREPASRLRHFLSLEAPGLPTAAMPQDLVEWFPRVAQALKLNPPQSAETVLTQLTVLRDAAHTCIREHAGDFDELARQLSRLVFLDKWIAQLSEALLALKL